MANKKDFAVGLVLTAPSPKNSGTTLVLRSGEGARMPATPFFATCTPPGQMTTLDTSEKISVTNVTGDTLTFTRAQGDTTAKNIDVDWIISNSIYTDDLDLPLDLKATQFPGICAETPILANDISINYTTRVLTITPPLGSFHYFTDGDGVIVKHTVTGPISFPAFTDTTGTWYFYFDGNGDAITTQTPWTDFALIASVYRLVWNSTNTPDAAKSVTELLETHTNSVSADEHRWMHLYGSVWARGLDVFSNFLATGTPNADGRNSVLSLNSGTFIDDNLPHNIISDTTPTNVWEQDLGNTTPASLNATNSGIFNIRYKGVGGVSLLDAGTRYPFLWDIATNRPQYVSASGVKTPVADKNFMVYFVYAIQDPRVGNTIRVTPAYAEYTSLVNAQAVTWETIQTQDDAAKDTEIRPLYRMIFEVRLSYDVGAKYSVLRQLTDIRKSVITQTTASGGSVNASAVVFTPTGAVSSTNVQSAIVELDNEKQPLMGADDNYVTDLEKSNLHAPSSDNQTDATLTFSDITTNDVSITKHGFAPKAPNDINKYLAGDATWATLPSIGNITYDELLTGSVNGTNTVFTTASNFNSIQLYKNGVAMHIGDDFTITGANQITMVSAPLSGTKLTATYVNTTSTMIQGSNSLITGEAVTASVPYSVFTTTRPYISGSLEVFVNGLSQKRITHFTETAPASGIFTTTDDLLAADIVTVNYQTVSSVSGNADTLDGYHASATPASNSLLALDANSKLPLNTLNTGSKSASVAAGQTTTSTSYTDLATVGPSVTVDISSNGLALVIVSSNSFGSDTTNKAHSFAISGASTLAADDINARITSSTTGQKGANVVLITGLNAGSTTFTSKYKSNAGTGTWESRTISVIPL